MNIVQKMIAGSVMSGMVKHYMKKLPKGIDIEKEKELIHKKKSRSPKVSGMLC
jgi:hypothetical protein